MNNPMTDQTRYVLLRKSLAKIRSIQDYVQNIYATSRSGALGIYDKIGVHPPNDLHKVFDDASVVAGVYDTRI
jgi:hypothetical protein